VRHNTRKMTGIPGAAAHRKGKNRQQRSDGVLALQLTNGVGGEGQQTKGQGQGPY
jgi:hypothetical protein